MTTLKKIEKKGYKVTANMGWKNGEQCIVSFTAERTDGRMIHKVTQPNISQLFKGTYRY